VGQRFAIGSLNDTSVLERVRDGLSTDVSDFGLMGAYRHWPRNFGTEGLKPDSLDELFFLEGDAVRCTGSAVRGLLSSQILAGAANLREALLRWMLPAHVDRLTAYLAAGNLLIWIPIAAPEQECAICLGLLRNSRNAVQIHDFAETETTKSESDDPGEPGNAKTRRAVGECV
jgi:hypothetical protein